MLEGTSRTYRCTDSHGPFLRSGAGRAGARLHPQVLEQGLWSVPALGASLQWAQGMQGTWGACVPTKKIKHPRATRPAAPNHLGTNWIPRSKTNSSGWGSGERKSPLFSLSLEHEMGSQAPEDLDKQTWQEEGGGIYSE